MFFSISTLIPQAFFSPKFSDSPPPVNHREISPKNRTGSPSRVPRAVAINNWAIGYWPWCARVATGPPNMGIYRWNCSQSQVHRRCLIGMWSVPKVKTTNSQSSMMIIIIAVAEWVDCFLRWLHRPSNQIQNRQSFNRTGMLPRGLFVVFWNLVRQCQASCSLGDAMSRFTFQSAS